MTVKLCRSCTGDDLAEFVPKLMSRLLQVLGPVRRNCFRQNIHILTALQFSRILNPIIKLFEC
jgi:hypothetical protein